MFPLQSTDDPAKVLQPLGSLLGLEMPPLRRDRGSRDPREPAKMVGGIGSEKQKPEKEPKKPKSAIFVSNGRCEKIGQEEKEE